MTTTHEPKSTEPALPDGPSRDDDLHRFRSPKPAIRHSARWSSRFIWTVLTAWLNRCLQILPPAKWWHRASLSRLEFTTLRLEHPGLNAMAGKRIAVLTDIHAGSFLGVRELERVFARVSAAEPDLVVFGGDLVNSRVSELDIIATALPALNAPLGYYAVPGNHELFNGVEGPHWHTFLDQNGIVDLSNRGERIGGELWLGGVDDYEEGSPDLDRALDGQRDGELTIVISHHPDYFPAAVARDVELMLSGHTHGGQIRFFGRALISHSKRGFIAGEFATDASRLYVSRGVGVSLLPIRYNCPAEVVFIELASPSPMSDA